MLIVTIIVIIILAATVVLTITKNNLIESAKEAVFKEDVRTFQDELNMYISKEYTNLQGKRDSKITAKEYSKGGEKNSVYTYLPDFKKKYEGKLAIKEANVNAKNLNRFIFYGSSNLESVTIGANVNSWGINYFFHVIKYQV